MNNLLMLERKKIFEEMREDYVIDRIKKFLKEKERKFSAPESLEALKKIKEYLKAKEDEMKLLDVKRTEIDKKIKNCCKHEILKKNYDQAVCLICGHWDFIKDVDYSHYFIEEMELYESEEIYEIIYKIAKNDEDILAVFWDYIEALDLKKTKVYRRIR